MAAAVVRNCAAATGKIGNRRTDTGCSSVMFRTAFATALQGRPLSHHFKHNDVQHSLQLSLAPDAAINLSCFAMRPDGRGSLWEVLLSEEEVKARVRAKFAYFVLNLCEIAYSSSLYCPCSCLISRNLHYVCLLAFCPADR